MSYANGFWLLKATVAAGLSMMVASHVSLGAERIPPGTAKSATSPRSSETKPTDLAVADAPMPNRDGVVTYAEVRLIKLAYQYRTVVEKYDQVSRHDPKWDRAARQFLVSSAKHFAQGDIPQLYMVEPIPPRPELARDGSALLASGCDDPLVQLFAGLFMMDEGVPRAEAALRAAADRLVPAGYSHLHAALAARRVARLAKKANEVADFRTRFVEHLAAASCGDVHYGDRYLVIKVWKDLLGDGKLQFLKKLETSPNRDGYLFSFLYGAYELDQAWLARGSGWANTVTDEGWKKYHAHLQAASDHFNRAWKLNQRLPFAPVDMISVAMGGGDDLAKGTAEQWFARAVDAQIDGDDAYGAMLSGPLLPRWGGSYDRMMELGRACIERPRFDSIVPWYYVRAVRAIGDDSNNSWGLLSNPDVYKTIQWIATETAKANPGRVGTSFYETAAAGVARKAEKFDEARAVLDRMTAAGHKPDLEGIKYFDSLADAPLALSEIYAKTSANALALERGVKDMPAHPDAALATIDRIRTHLAQTDPSVPYLNDLLKQCEFLIKLGAREWAPMQSSRSMVNWEAPTGLWYAENNSAIIGRRPNPGYLPGDSQWITTACFWKGPLPDGPFEIAADVERVTGQLEDASANNQPAVVLTAPTATKSFWIYLDQQVQAGKTFFDKVQEFPAIIKDRCEMRVRVDHGKVSLWVDGESVFADQPLPESFDGKLKVGFGSAEGSPIRFLNPRIRMAPADSPATRKSASRNAVGSVGVRRNNGSAFEPAESWVDRLPQVSPTVLASAGIGSFSLAAAGLLVFRARVKQR